MAMRLMIESDDQSGARNMAVDEFLLEDAIGSGRATVRVYGWREPTVSLGYFQAASDAVDQRFQQLAQVRRLSGGGAILHHQEVTYSITLGAEHPLVSQPSQIYRLAHEALLSVLAVSGVEARMRGFDRVLAEEPFLCFSRGDRHDIVIGENKIVGSAQRRRRGAVLQHGSLMLARSEFAPELPGLKELVPTFVAPLNWRTEIGRALARAVAGDEKIQEEIRLGGEMLAEADERRVQELIATTYSHLDWGHRHVER